MHDSKNSFRFANLPHLSMSTCFSFALFGFVWFCRTKMKNWQFWFWQFRGWILLCVVIFFAIEFLAFSSWSFIAHTNNEDPFKIQDFVVVWFYTPEYESSSKRLIKTCKTFHITCYGERILQKSAPSTVPFSNSK